MPGRWKNWPGDFTEIDVPNNAIEKGVNAVCSRLFLCPPLHYCNTETSLPFTPGEFHF